MSAAPVADLLWCALSSPATVAASYHTARMVLAQAVPGDFVECGVFAGTQAAAMARAIMDAGAHGRRVHLFDTFAGIPQAGPHDLEFLDAGHREGLSACGLQEVMDNMDRWRIPRDMLVFHEGLFADTVPKAETGAIAMLRLDGDLYESTKPCLEHLYPRLSAGGVLVVDDYGLSGCRKACDEYLAKAGNPGPAYWVRT